MSGPYGAWPSPVDAELVASGSRGYAELRGRGDSLFWLESRPDEAGRTTLVHWRAGVSRELTPAPFNPRSRVHEYGGGAFCAADDRAYFVNFADQNIYAVRYEAEADDPHQVTQGEATERFADLAWDGAAILAVRERHNPDSEPVNDLVRIDVASGDVQCLHSGHDFYAAPRPSGDGRLAFIAWDHPNMPFDGTQLFLVQTDDGADPTDTTLIAGGARESVVQPEWCAGRLVFATDAGGYWNLHVHDDSGVFPVLQEDAEYAGPAWLFGSSYYVPVGPRHVVARRVENGVPSLVLVDLDQGLASPLDDGCSSYAGLARTPRGVAFIAGFPDRPSRIVELELATSKRTDIASPPKPRVSVDVVSVSEPLVFSSTQGDAHAFLYLPKPADGAVPDDESPPLLVTTHGGPTSSTTADLSWRVQYYTSRGWAVADVNYGGSTGFGRAYRERLHGAWGQVDVEDCVACVRHLVAEGLVDPARIAIRGGSAGGYTTLAALAFTNVFKAGASHYGVGDLKALATDTHKFESRYLDTLVGDAEAMRERSPINHVERLNCPVIFFQGAEDKVVPPNQSETMRDALAAKGIPVAYLLFAGEGHGFRRAENVRRTIEAEYAFFARIFGIEPAGGLVEVEIENIGSWPTP